MSRKNNVNPNRPVLSSMWTNTNVYDIYLKKFTEIACNVIKWNLPTEIDTRFLELNLINKGISVFFYDEIMEQYLCLPCTIGGRFNVYNIPMERTAYATNGYQKHLTIENSVLIYNNYLRTPYINEIMYYAYLLTDIEQTINVNIKSQKTPIMILCDEKTRLSMKQLYMQYDGNEPYIFANDKLDPAAIQVVNTNSPYVADKLETLKTQVITDFLNFFGIEQTSSTKKERLVTAEASSLVGIVEIQRNVMLDSRLQACEQINNMFGLDVSCEFNSNLLSDLNISTNMGVEDLKNE